LFPGNYEIPHAKNFTAKTIAAHTMVIASIPLAARSISNLLNIRNIKIFGNTHRVIECVMILVSAILARYDANDIPPDEKRKINNPIINGKIKPVIRPVIILSNFSAVIF
jgi:hypothetical protein